MAGETTTLLYRFLGIDDGAGAQFDKMGAKTDELAGKSGRLTSALRSVGMGAVVAGATVAAASIKMAADFQTSMLRIHTQANVSTADVAKFAKGILAMAGDVATSPEVLAAAAYHIASVGQNSLTTAQQVQVLRVAARGAKLGGADLSDVVDALDAALVSGIKGVKNYGQAMGELNATVGAGDMTMQQLSEAYSNGVLVIAKQAGVSLPQLNAFFAVMGDNLIRGTKAGTMAKMSIQALEKVAVSGTGELAKIGLSQAKLTSDLQHGGLTKTIADVTAHLKAAGDTGSKIGPILTDIFGKKAGAGIALAVDEQTRYLGKLKTIGTGGTGFGSSWKSYTKSFGYALDGAKASAESLMISLGTKLLPTATRLMTWIRTTAIPVLTEVAHWFEQNKTAAAALAVGILAMISPWAALAAVVIAAYVKVKWFHDGVTAIVADLRQKFGGSFAAIEVAIKQFLGGAITWARAELDQFRAWWAQNGAAIEQAAERVWEKIGKVVGLEIKAFVAVARVYLPMLKAEFSDVFKIIEDLVAAVSDAIDGKWGKALGNLWKATKAALALVLVPIKTWGKTVGTLLYAAGQAVVNGLVGGIESLAKKPAEVLKSIGSGIKNSFMGAIDAHSPSRVFFQYGLWIVEGLVNGVKTYSLKASNAGTELATGLITGWKDGTSALKDALSTPVQAALTHLQTIVDTAIAKQAASLKTAKGNLKSLLASRKSDTASLAGTISSGAGLSNVFGTDPTTGASTVANLGGFLSSQVGPLKQFAKDLKWAAAHHLAPVLLGEIANLGPVQGDALLKQFMSGASSIVAANKAQALITSYSTAAASTAEDALYAKRVAKDRKDVVDNTKELRKLTTALHDMERHAAVRTAMTLTIDAKTGRPKVDDQFIKEIIAGIRKANRTHGKDLLKL